MFALGYPINKLFIKLGFLGREITENTCFNLSKLIIASFRLTKQCIYQYMDQEICLGQEVKASIKKLHKICT